MRRVVVILLALSVSMLIVAPVATAKGHKSMNFSAELSGDNEVPPVDTDAWGKAKFRVKGDTVYFKVIVHKPSSPVVASHIHQAPAGSNGPVVIDLLAHATKFKANKKVTLFSGSFPLSAHPDLVNYIMMGDTYVNVHTMDVPSGEVRGQIG